MKHGHGELVLITKQNWERLDNWLDDVFIQEEIGPVDVSEIIIQIRFYGSACVDEEYEIIDSTKKVDLNDWTIVNFEKLNLQEIGITENMIEEIIDKQLIRELDGADVVKTYKFEFSGGIHNGHFTEYESIIALKKSAESI